MKTRSTGIKRKTTTTRGNEEKEREGHKMKKYGKKPLKAMYTSLISCRDANLRHDIIEEKMARGNCDIESIMNELQLLDSNDVLKEESWKAFLIVMIVNYHSLNNIDFTLGFFKSMAQREANLEMFLTTALQHPLVIAASSRLDLEIEVVRFIVLMLSCMDVTSSVIMKMTGIELLWENVSERRYILECSRYPFLKRTEGVLANASDSGATANVITGFVPKLIQTCLTALDDWNNFQAKKEEGSDGAGKGDDDGSNASMKEEEDSSEEKCIIQFLHKSLELLIDMLSTIPTRRFVLILLQDTAFSTECAINESLLQSHKILKEAFETYQMYEKWYMSSDFFQHENNNNQKMYTQRQQLQMINNNLHTLQKMVFKYYYDSDEKKLQNVIFRGVTVLSSAKSGILRNDLDKLTTEELYDLAHRVRIVNTPSKKEKSSSKEFWMRLFIDRYTLFPTILDTVSSISLYPDELSLWKDDVHIIGNTSFTKNTMFHLPKINLQFLTLEDYFLRNFLLTLYESTYSIRSDIVNVIKRLDPIERFDGGKKITEFRGWARMGIEVQDVKVNQVGAIPLGGSNATAIPSYVHAEFIWDLSKLGSNVRQEWETGMQEYDNLFLLWIDASSANTDSSTTTANKTNTNNFLAEEDDLSFSKRYGIRAVRGCSILEIRDEEGVLWNDTTTFAAKQEENNEKDTPQHPDQPLQPKGNKRFVKVAFDAAQYTHDLNYFKGNEEALQAHIYSKFNFIIRRHGRENNFKCILETIRQLLLSSQDIYAALPTWIQPIVLGYGDPKDVTYSSEKMREYAFKTPGVVHPDAVMDFGDTFLSVQHLTDTFKGSSSKVLINGKEVVDAAAGVAPSEDENLKFNYRIQFKENDKFILATSYPASTTLLGNSISFTPMQISAIRSGISPGLTLILGPPGTGKTDVAVQIISNLYHTYPNQKTLLITHSNSALNDIFQKVYTRGDIHPRYMLRLGYGQRFANQQLDSEDFTKTGRVLYLLQRRTELLQQVQLLSESLGVSRVEERGEGGQSAYTCETAGYFYKHHIVSRIHSFDQDVTNKSSNEENMLDIFPFTSYFQLSNGSLLNVVRARNYIQQFQILFQELSEYHPLELLPTQRQRIDYLLIHQARIIAMTCTHASIIRSHLLDIQFQYDTIVMEEAAQMVEMETFISLVLQNKSSSGSRLKRIVLIGDPHQLPPIVKNRVLAEYSNLDQSLFRRMMRLGVPYIMLDRQGRCRPEIAKLYSWRYPKLSSLEHIHSMPFFANANPGLRHSFQFINVTEGRGETAPTPYFYQNVAEAEYIINLFQFLLFIGYPSDKISILVAYNGQKELILDMLSQRCPTTVPLFADVNPNRIVSTIDQYQGQQNDFILLSLVRTKSIGYLCDIRRWIVALSRARLGLYIFGHKPNFASSSELSTIMNLFDSHSDQLQLIKGEFYSTMKRKMNDDIIVDDDVFAVKDVTELSSLVYSLQEQLMVAAESSTAAPEEMDVEDDSANMQEEDA